MHTALYIFAFLLVGILLGAGYFALLFTGVTQQLRGTSSRHAIMLHVLRLAAAVLLFWIIAQEGATALLTSLAGFTVVLATLRPLTSP
jgi:N-ATPase, AtpR subunit